MIPWKPYNVILELNARIFTDLWSRDRRNAGVGVWVGTGWLGDIVWLVDKLLAWCSQLTQESCGSHFSISIPPWKRQGAVARSEACSLGMQAAPSSIPTSGTFFRGDLVMKTFLRPFSLFRWFKKSSCQLLAKECALSTGKLPGRLAKEQCG